MDAWQDSRERKRSHTQMSQQTTFSPSPIHSIVERYNSIPPPQRRRVSNPYNQPHSPRGVDNMPRSFSVLSQLQHQASRTQIVDLTDEADGVPALAPQPRPWQRAPSQLGRSDGRALPAVIDLTDDNDVEEESEVEITHSRQVHRRFRVPPPPAAFRQPPPREDSVESLFMPRQERQQRRSPPPMFHPRFGIGPMLLLGDEDGREDSVDNANGAPPGLQGMFAGAFGNIDMGALMGIRGDLGARFFPQAMPGNMDYDQHAFAAPKQTHVPPEPAKPGFTRSPKEGDTIICPSCDEELVHNKLEEQIIVKKGKKEPTKKEREEHPFWVLKDCGHVFCNKCYQNRIPTKAQTFPASFREVSGKKSTKTYVCAVENCPSEVRSKDKWVGVFL
ncbi:hypothetical protein BJ878DRAFT_485992 [Calycina marina]|uniref:Cell cycle control protein n=1 Tax=Calycina marina TaxID=1763456 RepID=A0A9P7ZBI3_9HELO|nr:hypothetical protein BJ878DRAFT_485992 [Calycina marina]